MGWKGRDGDEVGQVVAWRAREGAGGRGWVGAQPWGFGGGGVAGRSVPPSGAARVYRPRGGGGGSSGTPTAHCDTRYGALTASPHAQDMFATAHKATRTEWVERTPRAPTHAPSPKVRNPPPGCGLTECYQCPVCRSLRDQGIRPTRSDPLCDLTTVLGRSSLPHYTAHAPPRPHLNGRRRPTQAPAELATWSMAAAALGTAKQAESPWRRPGWPPLRWRTAGRGPEAVAEPAAIDAAVELAGRSRSGAAGPIRIGQV